MILLVLPDIDDEQALLSDARRGDRQAQRRIYEAYFLPIYQFIRLRVGEQETAQDIAADVFLDFFRALEKDRAPDRSLRAWLFRVANNKIYDHYGAQRKLPLTTLDEWIPISSEDDPELQAIRAVDVARVRRVLRLMVAEQQEVLILRYGQGLSLQETADLMSRSVSAVKSLQFRAVSRLRDLLSEAEVAPHV